MAAMEDDLGIDGSSDLDDEIDVIEATKSINLLKQQSE